MWEHSLTDMLQDLMRAVLKVCQKKFGDNFYTYALLDKHGERIGPANWLLCRSTANGVCIYVQVRTLTIKPPLNERTMDHSDTESSATSDDDRVARPVGIAETGSVRSVESTIDIDALLAGKHAPKRNRYGDASDTEEDAGARRHSLRPSRQVILPSEDWDYAVRDLPPNRTPRFLETPTNHTVVNLKTRDSQDLLFSSSESSEKDKGKDHSVTKDLKAEDNNSPAQSPPTPAAAHMQSALAQVPPFFSWPVQDKEHTQKNGSSVDVLDDVDSFLRQKFTYALGQRINTEQLASLYKSLKRPDNYMSLTETIDAGLKTHPRVEPLQGTVPMSSWQTLLFELIQRCDTMMEGFCSVDIDCTVTQKFGYARAALFKVSQISYVHQVDSGNRWHIVSLVLEDICHLFLGTT